MYTILRLQRVFRNTLQAVPLKVLAAMTYQRVPGNASPQVSANKY